MAAYAAVASLMNTIDDLLSHLLNSSSLDKKQLESLNIIFSFRSFSLDKKQLESLHMILSFLLDFIERYNTLKGSEEEEALESLIASVAHMAEDVIESHVVHEILFESEGDPAETSSSSLHRVITDVNAVKEKVVEFKGRNELKDAQPSNSVPSSTTSKSPSPGTTKKYMVGFEDELIQVMDVLTGYQSNLQIVPIVGMGGIGKTTLATNVYQNSSIVKSFDICAWVTISQNVSLIKILSELRSCMVNKGISNSLSEFACGMDLATEDELGLEVYQILCGRRYLIVLDDVWSYEIWDRLKFYFPDNGCRSRVVVTTRISNVAARFSSSSLEIKLLDEDKCWELFCREVFLGKVCPPELEEVGKMVVRECKRLPLSIVVVGGLLRSSSKTREHWEKLARDINSSLMLGNGDFFDILSLSYYHLPACLKSCFLYMGAFEEDKSIGVTKLVQLLVAEGFLRPKNDDQSLEEVAEDNLKELVDKNLISVYKRRWNGRIKRIKMHDLVREACLMIAEKEKFFYAEKVFQLIPDIRGECEFAYYYNIVSQVFDSLPSASPARAFRSIGVRLPFKSRYMRVSSWFNYDTLSLQANLRYLVCEPSSSLKPEEIPSKLPLSSVCLFWNLQTLIITVSIRIDATSEIWYMRRLRHLKIKEILLLDPPEDDDHVLPNLQTLSTVVNFSFTEEICKRLPNIKELRLMYDDDSEEIQNCFHLLPKLQSLHCLFHENLERGNLLQSVVFPSSLRKLRLENSQLHWEEVNALGLSLPCLEVLKLGEGAVVGPEWDTVERAFPRLKVLEFYCKDLIEWTAETSDIFPVLEKLNLFRLGKLREIPASIGEINTLGYLSLLCCSEFAAISSVEILKSQLDLGNKELQFTVLCKTEEEVKSIKEKMEPEVLTGENVMVTNFYDVAFIIAAAALYYKQM